MSLSLVLCGAIMSSSTVHQTVPFPKLPKEVREHIDEVLLITHSRYKLLSREKVQQAHKNFLKALGKLSQRVGKPLLENVKKSKGLHIDKNVILMAQDYAQHPQRYKDIFNAYNHPRSRFAAVLRPPGLEDKHTTETYRPMWELLTLLPHDVFFHRRIYEAISRIRNNESIPVLVQAYKVTVQKSVPQTSHSGQRQLRIFIALNHMSKKPALAAVLKCLSLSDKAAKGRELPKTSGFTIRQWAFRLLTDQDNYGDAAQWRKALKTFPTKGLSEKNRKLLTDALRKLEADAKKKAKPKP